MGVKLEFSHQEHDNGSIIISVLGEYKESKQETIVGGGSDLVIVNTKNILETTRRLTEIVVNKLLGHEDILQKEIQNVENVD